MINPADIVLTDNPITTALINTLGSAELEFCAALIVRYHQARELAEWTPVSREDIATLFEAPDPIIAVWARNPFWRPDPTAFAIAGFIDGWRVGEPAAKGTLTAKFFDALDAEHARRRERGIALGLRP